MVKDNQFTLTGFIVWITCALFFLYEFLLRTVIGTFQQPIMHDLQLSSFEYSIISTTAFLFAYALIQFPVGIIINNIGLKKSLLFACLLCATAAVGFGYANSYYAALIYRMLMGFGASFGLLCLIFSVFDWMPKRYNALFIGLSQFIGTIGPMLAAGPIESMSRQTDVTWRIVFLSLGVIGFLLSIMIAIFVKNNKKKQGNYIVLQRPIKIRHARNRIIKLFTQSQPWYIAIFSACIYCAIEYLSENEGKNFIESKGFDSVFASYMITISWFGHAIGCPLLGFLSDYFQRRKIFMILAALCCFTSITMITLSTNKNLLIFSFLLFGIGCSGQSLGFSNIAEQFKKQFLAIGLGLNNAMITIVTSLNAPLIGWCIDSSNINFNTSTETYYLSFSILMGIAFIACILSIFFIKESYCKSNVELTFLCRV